MSSGKCTYHGKKETCLLPKQNKYPVTKNDKLSPKRVKAAESYGSKMGVLKKLKKNGLCRFVKKAKIKNSKVCS